MNHSVHIYCLLIILCLSTGGAPDGEPRGAHADGDTSNLAELLAHLDSPEYLDTLHELADSLLKEITANSPGEDKHVSILDK